jgi:hypothetical protein
MALVRFAEVDSAAKTYLGLNGYQKTASSILVEETPQYNPTHKFDIFLSHNYHDVQISRNRLLGAKKFLEQFGYTVYVDWIIDYEMNRDDVNASTVELLRIRMRNSRCLLFLTSENMQQSKWMPWQIGYMDGRNSRVAIFPLARSANLEKFYGQDYLGAYPFVEAEMVEGTNTRLLWVSRNDGKYIGFQDWLAGKDPFAH